MAVLTEIKMYSNGDFLSNRLGLGKPTFPDVDDVAGGVVFVQ